MSGNRNSGGRNRKPAELKVITGTFRADRERKPAQIGEAKFPRPPAFLQLSGRERRVWRLLGDHCGAWTAASDWPTVWATVRLIERLIRCQEAQSETESAGHPLAMRHTIKHLPKPAARAGEVDDEQIEIVEAKANPLILLEVKLFEKLRPFIALLGLTPVDRGRMPTLTAPAGKGDPIDALLKRMRSRGDREPA
jgi:hypothetical protein